MEKILNKNRELEELMNKVYKDGFNIYALINKVKSYLHQPRQFKFPDRVIWRVCSEYLKNKDSIRNQWAWFVVILRRESEMWFAQQNIQQSQQIKNKVNVELLRDLFKKAGKNVK